MMKAFKILFLAVFALVSTQSAGQQQLFLNQTGGAPPTAGLLDQYKGAAFAAAPDVLLYSTYSATDDIAGSLTNGQVGQWSVAVFRDFDDAIKSFTPAEVADGTANTWVQELGPSDGFVRRWYDQSVTALDVSNLNHAEQSDPTKMPKLFDSITGLILENGKAALNLLDNSAITNQQHLAMPFAFGAADTYSAIFSVFTLKESGNFTHILGSDPPDKGFVSLFNINTRTPRVATIRTDIAAQNATNSIQLNTPTLRVDAANRVRVITRIDANEVINITDNNQNYQTATENLIGNNVYDIITANINFQTLVIYTGNTDRASQIPDIETALNDYYSIY